MGEDLLWVEFGKIYTKLGAFDDALAAFHKAIDLNPDSGLAYCNLAFAYHEKGEYGKAAALYRKSIPMLVDAKNQAIAWNNLGNTYRVLRDLENANLAYQKADALEMELAIGIKNQDSPVKPDDSLLPAEIKEDEKIAATQPNRKLQSMTAITGAATETPLTVEARPDDDDTIVDGRFVSLPYSADGKESTTTAKSSDPIPVGAQQSRPDGQVNVLPQPENGLQSLQAIVPKQKPGIGNGQEKSDPALEEILAKIQIYENITKANPMNDRGWDTLGKYYKLLGRFSDAIAAYQNAIHIAPSKEVYYYYLGLLYSAEKQYENAIRAFLDVIRINPDYVLAHSALAGLYRRLGMEAKANVHISLAMPKMANESAYNRACFYATCGDTELAIEFLRLALQNKDTTIEWILSDPDLDQIREDSRFQALIEASQNVNNATQNYLSAPTKSERTSMLELLNSSMVR